MPTYKEISGMDLPEACAGCMYENYSMDCAPCSNCGGTEEEDAPSEYVPNEEYIPNEEAD